MAEKNGNGGLSAVVSMLLALTAGVGGGVAGVRITFDQAQSDRADSLQEYRDKAIVDYKKTLQEWRESKDRCGPITQEDARVVFQLLCDHPMCEPDRRNQRTPACKFVCIRGMKLQ